MKDTPTRLDVSRLENVRHKGSKTIARCPACAEDGHDKSGDHLSIDGQGRFTCVKNQGAEGVEHRKRIFALVGITPAKKSNAKTYPTIQQAGEAVANRENGTLAESWTYTDDQWHEVLAVVRVNLAGDKKTFRPFRRSVDGWASGDPAGPLPLYRLPDLAKDTTGRVFITEGEKCADAVRALGLIATTSAHGAKAADKSDWTPLGGRDVVIVPDHDESGKAYAQTVSRLLSELDPPATVRIVELPDLAEGEDVFDFIAKRRAAGGTDEDLRFALTFLADEAKPEVSPDAVALVNAGEWIDNAPPPSDSVVSGIFDAGDKVLIVGSSKCRKTFFILMLALLIAAGRGAFLGWAIPRSRRVLFIQMEVKESHFWRRVHVMARKLGVSREELSDRLAVVSARGQRITPRKLVELAQKHGAEIVILDPIYKLIEGDENLAVDVKPLLAAFDHITQTTGAAVLYVQHNAKGTAGDREARDRGAGSGVIARDFDAAFYLTEHRDGGELRVVETLLRNYAPQDAVTIEWDEGCFIERQDVEPCVKTSKDHLRANGRTGPKPTEADALRMIEDKGPMLATITMGELRALGFTKAVAEQVRDRLRMNGKTDEWKGGKPCKVWIGTPEAIASLKARFTNPAAVSLEQSES